MLTTTLAASVLLGGGVVGLLQSKAFADTTGVASTPTTDQAIQDRGAGQFGAFRGGDRGFGGAGLLQETAAVLGLDEQSVKDKVKSGQTLLQIAQDAGWTEEDFLQKLVETQTAKIDEALTAGTIEQAEADKRKENLADRLKQSIENQSPSRERGPRGQGGQEFGGRGHGGNPGLFGNEDTLTSILGITPEELRTAKEAGQSIAEIAAAQALSEEDLISKLKDGLTDQLKQFVESKPRLDQQQPGTDEPSVNTDTTTEDSNT